MAQAAHAVQQQAASLQVAAEIHAAKAHAATSQVASLQATAQVIAATHDELVKKIEDVKQTAVAQIQQPQARHGAAQRGRRTRRGGSMNVCVCVCVCMFLHMLWGGGRE